VAARIDVPAEVVRRTLDGVLKISPDGATRTNPRYLQIGGAAARPDPMQAAWLYSQMVRWGQALLAPDLLAAAQAVFSPATCDAVLGPQPVPDDAPPDGVGAFAGPAFDPLQIPDLVSLIPRG